MIKVRKTELYHHGIKGQKWGIRRFQNEDGTLTAEGRERYLDDTRTKYTVGRGLFKSVILSTRGRDNLEDDLDEFGIEIPDDYEYEGEYAKTPEGKKRWDEYSKLIDTMIDGDGDFSDSDWEHFSKVEEAYLRGQGEYYGKKVVDLIGPELASKYYGNGKLTTSAKEAIAGFGDDWWVHAI